MAVFTLLDDPVDLTLSTTGSFETIDVSTWLPSGAKAAVLLADLNSATTGVMQVRHPSSTTALTTWSLASDMTRWCACACDASRQIALYRGASTGKFWLLGYTDDAAWTFPTNWTSLGTGPTATSTWEQTDVASQTTGTATAAIIASYQAGTNSHAVRPTGVAGWSSLGGRWRHTLVKLNGSEQYDWYRGTTTSFYMVGYYTGSDIVWDEDGSTSLLPGTTGSWQDVSVPSGALWVAHHFTDTGSSTTVTGSRRNGSTEDGHRGRVVLFRSDMTKPASDVIEIYAASTATFGVYLTAYEVSAAVLVAPAAAATHADAVSPTVVYGSLSISPAAAVSHAEAPGPTVLYGSTEHEPDEAISSVEAQSPAVLVGGSVSFAPAAAGTTVAAMNPRVIPEIAVPDAAGAAAAAVSPTVVQGNTSVAPAVAVAAVTASSPSVAFSFAAVEPEFVVTGVAAVSPTVVYGASVVAPAAATTAVVARNPIADVSGMPMFGTARILPYTPRTWERVGIDQGSVLTDNDFYAIQDADGYMIGLGIPPGWKRIGGPAN